MFQVLFLFIQNRSSSDSLKQEKHKTIPFLTLCHNLLFIYLFLKYLFIYLAALGLNCGTQDPPCRVQDLRCGMWDL